MTLLRLPHRLRMAWRGLVHRRAMERELDEELQFHMQQLAERYARREHGDGPTPPAADPLARQAAQRRFGGIDQIKEACRDMRTLHPLEDFLRDIRFGARLLLRSPVFSIVAVLSLAIGIGFNSAIFTLVHAIILRTLPVPNPQQLMIAEIQEPNATNPRFGYPTFLDARDALQGQITLAAATDPMGGLIAMPRTSGSAEPTPGTYQLVSGEYFTLLQQTAQIGRLLGPQDNVTLGGHPVAVISDGFWSRQFGRSPSALGSELLVNGTTLTIVGVTRPKFFGTSVAVRTPDVWAPIMMQTAIKHFSNASMTPPADGLRPWPPQRNVTWLAVFARITQPGQEARVAEALQIGRRADMAEYQSSNPDAAYQRYFDRTRVQLTPAGRGLSGLRNDMTDPLRILLVMVGLLLLIACANIASLLIARSASRAREMAVRLSIGAGRLRLVRQLLAESLLLALCGGVLGLVIASWGGPALLMMASRTTRTPDIDLGVSWQVILFTLAVSILAGLLFGLLPALRSTRVSLSETLRAQSRNTVGDAAHGGRARLPFGKLLVAAQMAFCLLLLVVAGLFGRTLQHLTQVDLGVDKDQVVAARLSLRSGGYTEEQLPALYDRLIERARRVPGVTSASMSLFGPLFGGWRSSSFGVEGYQAAENEDQTARVEIVTAANLQTLGIPLVEGRYFTEADIAAKRRVAIINETLAKKYFKGRSPIGKRYGTDTELKPENSYEIVGVVKDARYNDLRGAMPNMAFLPFGIEPDPFLFSLEVRSTRPAAATAADLRAALREVEPKLPIIDIMPIRARVENMLGQDQLVAYLTALFGGVALLLACLGLYGTISYAVSRRTSELGVRLALGASRGNVLWLVLREALTLVAVGLIVGLPLAFLAAQGISRLLYGVRPTDVTAAGGASLVLVLVAAVAAYLPARRASRVDPMLALRAD